MKPEVSLPWSQKSVTVMSSFVEGFLKRREIFNIADTV